MTVDNIKNLIYSFDENIKINVLATFDNDHMVVKFENSLNGKHHAWYIDSDVDLNLKAIVNIFHHL